MTLVVPTQPTDDELAAGLSLAASMGQLAFNDFQLTMMTADQVSDTAQANTNLIVLGSQQRQAYINQFVGDTFPIVNLSASLQNSPIGFLQEITSPWNASRS